MVVIPGRRAAASPEPILQRPVFMGSGLAPLARPGMTIYLFCKAIKRRGAAGRRT